MPNQGNGASHRPKLTLVRNAKCHEDLLFLLTPQHDRSGTVLMLIYCWYIARSTPGVRLPRRLWLGSRAEALCSLGSSIRWAVLHFLSFQGIDTKDFVGGGTKCPEGTYCSPFLKECYSIPEMSTHGKQSSSGSTNRRRKKIFLSWYS